MCSCVEPFNPESFKFEKAIVVDGLLTDQYQSHQIKLSYTRPVGADTPSPLTGAEVWVIANESERIDYSETSPGEYTSQNPYAGAAGSYYQLFFTTPEGENFQSTNVELIPSPQIDSIYDQFVKIIEEDADDISEGIQFFLDTHDESGLAKSFRYEWEETYEIRVPYPSYYIFRPDEEDSIVSREIQVGICYDSARSSNTIIGTSTNSKENRLANMPVRYLTSETDKLRSHYSILVRQYAISELAYSFYRKLLESNESNGSLFDQQQGTIAGNISSIDNPSITVLGIFDVAGVSSKRAFFRNSDLDPKFTIPDFRFTCASNDLVMTTLDSVRYYTEIGYNIFYLDQDPETDEYVPILGFTYCTDCTGYASNQKPSYWTP